MSANTLMKYLFCYAIFSKLVKLEPYLAILLFYGVNLTATVAKFQILLLNFFLQKSFP